MKLSKTTKEVLANFATINQSLYFFKGKTLRVKNMANTIVARAKIEEDIPKEFAIYDVNALLRVVDLFDEADLEFQDKNILISENLAEVRYVYADPDVIAKPKEKDFAFPDDIWKLEFVLEAKVLANILAAASVMKLPDIVFDEDGIKVKDIKNGSSDSFKIKLKYTATKKAPVDWKIVLKPESLVMLPGDYTVTLCEKKIVEFKANSRDLAYWIATQAQQDNP